MQKLIHKYFTLNTFRTLGSIALVLFLSACTDDDQTSQGGDANIANQSQCWQTKIIAIALSQIDKLLTLSSAQVIGSNGGPAVILLGFSIWMAFKLLKILPSFKEENLGEVWTEIGQKLFVCSFCAIAVSSQDNIYWVINTFVLPIYNTLLELGSQILGTEEQSATIDLGIFGNISFTAIVSDARCKAPVVNFEGHGSAGNLAGYITDMAGCLSCNISDRLNSGVQIGVKMITSLQLVAMLVGSLMVTLFTAAKFGFLFFVVDSLFRMNFAAFLFPLFIMGVPFNYTRKWSKYGFLMFINSSGIMLFMAILVCLAVNSLEKILDIYAEGEDFVEGNFSGAGPIMLSLFLVTMLLINIPGFAVSLANKFIGGGNGLEFQKKISQFAEKAVKKAAASALGSISGGLTTTATSVMEKYETTRKALDHIKQVSKSASDKINKAAGYNDDDE